MFSTNVKTNSPEELAQYKPVDPIPVLQSALSFDLIDILKKAEKEGAVVIGKKPKTVTVTPALKVEQTVNIESNKKTNVRSRNK